MLDGWSEFFVATAGAAAALAGLIIVAMSVNIQTILNIPSMTSRAAATIASLILSVADRSRAGHLLGRRRRALGVHRLRCQRLGAAGRNLALNTCDAAHRNLTEIVTAISEAGLSVTQPVEHPDPFWRR
jgi:hypothetical protein